MRLLALLTILNYLRSSPGKADSLRPVDLPCLVNSFPGPEHGSPGRSSAWGRDEFCISTTIIQQVQSVE